MSARPSPVMRTPGAIHTEHPVARLAEHQLLVGMPRAFRDDVPPLPRHQVQELVYDEARGESAHASAWDRDGFSAYRTSEGSVVSALSFEDPLQAAPADGVRTRQKLRVVLLAIVHAQARPACQETVIEVLVVDGDGLDQSGRHAADVCNVKHGLQV